MEKVIGFKALFTRINFNGATFCYNSDMYEWRLYIDESGDHTYKHIANLDTRYLGLTGVLIRTEFYDKHIRPDLEVLKRKFFRYDPDNPPILVRSYIKHRKRWFYVLQDEALNSQWEEGFLNFISGLRANTQIFTVVMDKKEHIEKYPVRTFDPYVYSLAVLLNRVRGFLVQKGEYADIIAESRGKVEDQQIMKAYRELRETGSYYGDTGEYYQKAYPEKELIIKRKDNNVAGLQLADVMAFGQKVQTVLDYKKPFSRPLGDFTKKLNDVADKMVNRYGRYLLE